MESLQQLSEKKLIHILIGKRSSEFNTLSDEEKRGFRKAAWKLTKKFGKKLLGKFLS